MNFLSLLLVVVSVGFVCGDSMSLYKQQVIVILDDELIVQKTGQLLYERYDTYSHVLKWNGTTQMLEQVEWNADVGKFEATVDRPLPIGEQQVFSWSDTRLNVLGLIENMTLSGFSPDALAALITEDLASESTGYNVNILTTSSKIPAYLSQFMYSLRRLQKFETTASLTSTIAWVDHSGRELTGKIVTINETVAIEWRHANLPNMWTGYFTASPSYEIEVEQVASPAGNPAMAPPYFGILPEGGEVHVTDYHSSARPPAYRMTDNSTFEWVDQIAEKTYKDTPIGRAPEYNRQVQFLLGTQNVSEIQVVEIEGILDLLKELRHYGDKGPAANATYVYYRFGSWVLRMNLVSFSAEVVGIIVSPADPEEKLAQVESIRSQWRPIPNAYPSMQLSTTNSFLDDVTEWINGEHGDIVLDMETAYNAQCGVGMFFSEAIRSFHVHIANMISLDLAQDGYLTTEYIFNSHPIVREGTWQILDSSGRKKTGLETLRDSQARSGSLKDEAIQAAFDDILLRLSLIGKTWLSHIDDTMVVGSRSTPPRSREEIANVSHLTSLLSAVENIGSIPPWSETHLRVFELQESASRLLSLNISEPEMRAIDTQILDFTEIDHRTLPLQASIALNSDHAYISDLISEELHQKEYQTGKKYEVVPDTVDVDEDSDIVKFFVRELNDVSSELEPIKTNFDQSKLRSKALLKKLLSLYNGTTTPEWYKKGEAWLKKGEAIHNTIIGMISSIKELEDGKILKGAFDLAKNAYKFGKVTGIDKMAAKFLGKALKGLADKAGESATFSVAKKVEGKVTALVGDFKALKAKFAPIIGTLFNVYSIVQDFNHHSTIGYIDAAFDIATTVLSLFGPEAEPFAAALSIIKVGVDYFYTDISRELHALPPDPSVGQVVVAVLKGIGEGILDIIKDIWNNINIFGIIGNAHKLDDQYNKDQDFLRSIADYQHYYSVVRENGSNFSEINFAGGPDSWNGGDIIFHLGENGLSTLTLETTDTSGNPHNETHQISTNSVADIVLGIGETHAFTFRKVTITALWVIHVDSKNIISGDEGEKQTLYGTYYGNSQNNKFIAVQELPPEAANNLNYNLRDYHYTLYGGGGNDSFYLGPQPTYVEGNEGSDSYFINSTATITEINSHSGDGQDDIMIINLNFSQIQAQKDGLNLNLISSITHKIVLRNWFHDVTHQRVVFKTGDGVLFKVSATITEALMLIPYALSGSSATQAQVYDARLPLYSNVFAIAGSKYNDTLYGNDLDNQLNGAGGNDHMTGGEGQDTYHVDLDKGVDTINNFAVSGEVDTLIIGTDLDELLFTSEEGSNNLFITRNETGTEEDQTSATGAVIKDWFLNETYRHLLVVTNDQSVVKVSSNKTQYVSYQPFIINMSKLEEEATDRGELYDGVLDLNSSPDYSEVTTVVGTCFDDTIIGNGRDNYISAKQGLDFIEGKEGADTYVVRKGDGGKTILNCAKDKNVDTLLFDVTFDEVHLSNTSRGDLVLSGCPESDIEVTFSGWFNDSQCQHLLVRSVDGVTFELPNTTESLTKTAKSVDNSNLTTDVQLVLAGKWGQVERVVGSQGDDQIRGNSLDNYIDPGVGNSYLEGGNGSDTYIIQSTYGENIINNYAEDNQPDSIFFNVPYRMIEAEVVDGMHIRLSSLSDDGLVSIKLVDYNFEVLDNARHLMVTTSDGISFVLPVANSSNANNYKPIPVSINTAHATTGQHLHLMAYSDFTEVRTVYGASKYQNSIVGNGQNNTLIGGSKSDFLQGLDGDDTLKGEGGDDVINGGSGFDVLIGGYGDDSLDGGEDDDIIFPGTGTNQIIGGEGTDTVIYSGDLNRKEGIILDLSDGRCIHDGDSQDLLEGIENAYGTNYDDVIAGDDQDNVLMGMGGNDTLSPGSGYDILNGGNGSDIYDITYASGTVTIENLANDQDLDLVIFGYANLSSLWYEIAGDDVVVRKINTLHPMFYDGNRPAVVFRSFMKGPVYQHISIETADGNITSLAAFINGTDLSFSSGSTMASPDTSLTTSELSGPVSSSSSGRYIALGILLATLAVFVSFILLGAYKVCRRKVKKRYIKL